MLALMLAAAVAASKPPLSPVPANPCNPAESCRYVGEFDLKDAQGRSYKVVVDRWLPYLSNGRLSLLPGEVVSLTLSDAGLAVASGSRLTAEDRDAEAEATAGQAQAHSQVTGQEEVFALNRLDRNTTFAAEKDSLRIGFLQTETGEMLLRATNGYSQPVTYRAAILRPGAKGPSPTSVCAIMASKASLETLGPPIIEIDLSDFALQPAGADSFVCR